MSWHTGYLNSSMLLQSKGSLGFAKGRSPKLAKREPVSVIMILNERSNCELLKRHRLR